MGRDRAKKTGGVANLIKKTYTSDVFSDDELKKMGIGKGDKFLSYLLIFGGMLLVVVFAVAFIHDAFTGQLPNGGGYSEDGGYDGFGRR